MPNVLISGGAGFIGSHLASHLHNTGHAVTVLDNLSSQVHGPGALAFPAYNDHVISRFVNGDVRSRQDWLEALQNQDIVVHFAAETGTGQSMYQIARYTETNIGGTALLCDILTSDQHHVAKVILASSRAVYGEGKYLCQDDGIVYPKARRKEDLDRGDFDLQCPICGQTVTACATDENSLLSPSSVYALSKQVQEQMLGLVCTALGMPVVVLRYQNVYGPGQSLSNPYTGILSIFSTRLLNGNEIHVFEDGRESRDFVHVDDVARATAMAIAAEEANNQILNVGSGVATDVLTVAHELAKSLGIDATIRVTGGYRLGDIRHNYADIGRIRQILGFEPQIRFAQGIRRLAEWVKSQPVQDDKYVESIQEMSARGLYRRRKQC